MLNLRRFQRGTDDSHHRQPAVVDLCVQALRLLLSILAAVCRLRRCCATWGGHFQSHLPVRKKIRALERRMCRVGVGAPPTRHGYLYKFTSEYSDSKREACPCESNVSAVRKWARGFCLSQPSTPRPRSSCQREGRTRRSLFRARSLQACKWPRESRSSREYPAREDARYVQKQVEEG